MKWNKLIVSAAMALTVMMASGAVLAGDDHHKGDKKKDWSDFRMMMTERHNMMVSMMDMQKQTMEILKGLNHKPSSAEKTKLGEMIGKMDEMIAADKKMSKKMMKKWQGDGHHGEGHDKGSW